MSFGLGYFENGIWVDHSNPDRPAASNGADGNASLSGGVALDAVHRWYGCCADSAAAQPLAIGELGMSGEPDRHVSVVAVMPTSSVRAVEK